MRILSLFAMIALMLILAFRKIYNKWLRWIVTGIVIYFIGLFVFTFIVI